MRSCLRHFKITMDSLCAVVVPVYLPSLCQEEAFALDHSIQNLKGRDIFLAAPDSLDLSYYLDRHPCLRVERFDAEYFSSIKGYNRLLLGTAFYERFAGYEFMLLLQTDAIVFRDDLDAWMKRPFDYVGAPWPGGHELRVAVPPFEGDLARHVRACVGNGGFSLRRNSACVALLQEFPVAVEVFLQSGSSEDLFFAFMGMLSRRFVLPNELTASQFAFEREPEVYFALNGKKLPMGAHAWCKYSPGFWKTQIKLPGDLFLPA